MSEDLDQIKARLNKLEHEKMIRGIIIKGIDENEDAIGTVAVLADALEVQLNVATDIICALDSVEAQRIEFLSSPSRNEQ